MASANVVYGKAAGGLPILSSDFSSELVASGAVSTSIPANSVVRVTALDGAVYVAAGAAATTNPRILLGAIGSYIDLHMKTASTIAVQNAP